MATFFNSTEQRAQKAYKCDACHWLREAWNQADIDLLPPDEREAYEKAKANNFKIMPGDKYIKQAGIYDDRFGVFRGLVSINDICHKYELYPNPNDY